MLIKKFLYRILPLKGYLKTVSRLYFVSFNAGLLRGKKAFDYPYFLPNIIKRGDTVIDIGANLGYYTVPMAKIVGPEGRVYAVEPVKEIREVLAYNTRKFKNVTIIPFALGTEDKDIRIGNDSPGRQGYMATGVNMVLDQNTGTYHAAMEFSASMRRGSELFKDLERLDFIKCDIEGYEPVVIPEMKPVLERFHPAILMETGGGNRKKMVEFMTAEGYSPYVLRGGKLVKLKAEMSEDILFIHNSIEGIEKYRKFIK